ncbi:MAG: ABC transporter permease [Anaerolinea sp.]|nr:ABC transporter permease [Anaerolinea sp.]
MQANAIYDNLRQVQRRISTGRRGTFAPIIGVLALFVVWQVVTLLRLYPEFIIPPPSAVFDKFIIVLRDGRLWLHTSTTVSQMLMGLGVGVMAGVALGYGMAKSRILEDVLSPVVLVFQSTPVVAYAPLLVIWFGNGSTSKIVTSALIVFFPMLMNTIVSIRSVPLEQRELMRSFGATARDLFLKLEVPASLPVLLSGLKVSATLAVIGAVVGEFVSANAGLGFLIKLARDQFDTPLVWVAIFTLALIARVMYGLVALLERRLLKAQRRASSVTTK